VPRQNNKDKSDDDANSERHPKNIHLLTTQSFDCPRACVKQNRWIVL
jgi:hypothetical protein